MNIVFLFLLTFCLLNGAEEKETAEFRAENVHGATLIVGCVRGPGSVQDAIAGIVGQATADFSHNSSFPGENVISVDMGPCRTSQLHIEGDWLTLPFADNSQKCVMAEWLPSSMNYFPLLFHSTQKAYSVLAPGGELIIDHMPYLITLAGNWKEALDKLNGFAPKDILFKSVLSKLPKKSEDRYIGIVSKLLQQHDPFTLSISRRERADIWQLLKVEEMKLLGEEAETQIQDKQTNPVAVNASIDILCTIFKKERLAILQELATEITTTDTAELLNTFEWIYGMHSRGPTMLEALRTIGFEVAADAMQYHEINPYNGRRHAWIIKGRKPATITTAAEEKEDI